MGLRGPPVVRRIAFLGALLAVALVASGGRAQALSGTTRAIDSSVTETISLAADSYTGYAFSLAEADSIVYAIRVTEGGAIDVYFVPPVGLAAYATDGASTFPRYGGTERQTELSGTFADPTAIGSVTVVIDNANLTGAQAAGPVTVALTLTKSPNLLIGGILFIICGVATLGVTAVLLLLRRRKGAVSLPPTPYGLSAPPSGPKPEDGAGRPSREGSPQEPPPPS